MITWSLARRSRMRCNRTSSAKFFGRRRDALRTARDGHAAAILVDARLKDHDTAHLATTFRDQLPGTNVVITGLTTRNEGITALIAAGARGFIMKDAAPDEYATTVSTVSQGGHVLPRRLASALFGEIVRAWKARRAPARGFDLSARESQVLELIGDGLTNKEIAARLNVSVHTVKSHVRHVLDKLGLRSRQEAAVAVRHLTQTQV